MDGRFFKRLINESLELLPAVQSSFAGVLLLQLRVIVILHIFVTVEDQGPVNFGIYQQILAFILVGRWKFEIIYKIFELRAFANMTDR